MLTKCYLNIKFNLGYKTIPILPFKNRKTEIFME